VPLFLETPYAPPGNIVLFRAPFKKTGPFVNPCHNGYTPNMGTHTTRTRGRRRNEIARKLIEDSESLNRRDYEQIASEYACSLRTVYRDVDWVAAQLKQGWVPPPPQEEIVAGARGQYVDHGESRFPDHKLAIEDALIDGRWSNREAKIIDESYEAGGVRKVLRDAEGVKGVIRGDLDADGVRLSVSIQIKRLHRTVARHSQMQNDDMALKAESELAKLHRGVIPLLGRIETAEDLSPEEADFYRQLLGKSGGDS
tara:strand:+ start:627 stop:1391 length:765 start_codon:yes stop_codon:yes gene_type:complete